MNIEEVIKLSNRIDSRGSIKLPPIYTPILDWFLKQYQDSNTLSEGFYYNDDGVNSPSSVVWGITIKKTNSVKSNQTNLIENDNSYEIICGFLYMQRNQLLIRKFLKQAFDHCYKSDIYKNLTLFENYDNSGMNTISVPFQHRNSEFIATVARIIVAQYQNERKYSIIVFESSESSVINQLAYHINYILLKLEMGGHIFANLDLRNYVPTELSYEVPSICVYSNILEVYQDALNCKTIDKKVLCNQLDQLNQTEGAISLFSCYCADKVALDKLSDKWDTPDLSIKSFYRIGRVDNELTINSNTMILYNKVNNKSVDWTF